ncbi:MAG: signal peptidase II [Alphaproteobacteria bacterium]
MMGLAPPRFGFALAALVIVLDQLSKWWILEFVMAPPRVMPLAPFFNLVLVHNRGVSFGMFGSAPEWLPWALALFAVMISAVLAIWLWRTGDRLLASALGLVIGGALGNVIDRIRYGAVVDFLDFHAAGYHWPAFNVADAAITIGVGFLLIDALKSPLKRQ